MQKRVSIAALVVALFLPSFATPAVETKGTGPEAIVTAVYAAIARNDSARATDCSDHGNSLCTKRLQDLFALDSKEAGGEVGRIDFDFWTNAQDDKITDVHVSSQAVENASDRRVVTATFKNLGKREEIHFYFERGKTGWLLDDARSVLGEKWTLSLILKYGWDGKP